MTVKYCNGFILLLMFSLALSAQETATEAPPAAEIADAYVEVIGGTDAWVAVKGIELKGKTSMQGMDFPMTVTSAEGDMQRVDIDIQGSPMTQAYDGETAWMIFPMQGITEPKEMTEAESKSFRETPFLNEFVNYAERGYALESVEGKEIEGAPTYGVRITHDNGYDRTYYFDTENMVPLMMSMTADEGPTKGMTLETYMSDYQEVDGLMMAMFMEQKMNGQTVMKMTMDEANIDPEIEDGFFSKPE